MMGKTEGSVKRLQARAVAAPALVGPSISMGYVQNEVPSGEETFLRVFVMTGTTWIALPTTLDVDNNIALAPAQGPGLYVLMSTIEISLYGPGWDAFSYPVQITQTVEQALQSIVGKYSIV